MKSYVEMIKKQMENNGNQCNFPGCNEAAKGWKFCEVHHEEFLELYQSLVDFPLLFDAGLYLPLKLWDFVNEWRNRYDKG